MLPEEDLFVAQPIPMKNQDDIIKGLSSFVEHWESLAWKDPFRSYTRSYDDLIAYWAGVRDTLKVPPPPQTFLLNGF
jgi:hypothetical protein